MVKAKIFKLKNHFYGLPKPTDVELVEEELPALKKGEALIQAVYISVDPYNRSSHSLPIGSTYVGNQVAKIIESKNDKLPVGEHVIGNFGWRTHTIIDRLKDNAFLPEYFWPKYNNVPLSYAVGVLGMPGNTAYLGFLEVCKPKAGETVVVSSAAGAVGNIVGQIAKIKGCTVIGITGSDKKGQVLINELGFDHYINYKTQNLDEELTKVAPNGVDCYFDNVGGDTTYAVVSHMNMYGRISVCGSLSSVSPSAPQRTGSIQSFLQGKKLVMESWIVTRWRSKWMDAIDQLHKWILEGKIKVKETTYDGFDNMFDAFSNIFQGKHIGKPVVRV